MKEFRCPLCGKLLGRVSGCAEIKCPRCKRVCVIDTQKEQSKQHRR